MWQLVDHLIASCSFCTTLVVLYSTDNNSIVAGSPLSVCVTTTPWSMTQHCHAMGSGAAELKYEAPEPGIWRDK